MQDKNVIEEVEGVRASALVLYIFKQFTKYAPYLPICILQVVFVALRDWIAIYAVVISILAPWTLTA